MTDDTICLVIRFVPMNAIEKYRALGWIAHPNFFGTDGVLMEWIGKAEPVEPEDQ